MASMDYENENGTRYEDEAPRYERDRSASPRPNRRNDSPRGGARRSASPTGNGHGDNRGMHKNDRGGPQDDGAINPGSNLFVTGIHPRLRQEDVTSLFVKYGEVERCQIMCDPHTNESRGFGFVKMVTAEQADAAKEGLQGEEIEGRTLSIEKARRSRPRTPTPGKYFGPPKRDEFGPPQRGGGYGYRDRERYDDRRGGGGYREDRYRDRDDYRSNRDDRDGGRPSRDGYYRDRYGGSRDDRYSGRGGGGGYYERHGRSGRDDAPAAAFGDPARYAPRDYSDRERSAR